MKKIIIIFSILFIFSLAYAGFDFGLVSVDDSLEFPVYCVAADTSASMVTPDSAHLTVYHHGEGANKYSYFDRTATAGASSIWLDSVVLAGGTKYFAIFQVNDIDSNYTSGLFSGTVELWDAGKSTPNVFSFSKVADQADDIINIILAIEDTSNAILDTLQNQDNWVAQQSEVANIDGFNFTSDSVNIKGTSRVVVSSFLDDAITFSAFASTEPTAWWNEGKAGYSLASTGLNGVTQSSGSVIVGTNNDKTNYTLAVTDTPAVYVTKMTGAVAKQIADSVGTGSDYSPSEWDAADSVIFVNWAKYAVAKSTSDSLLYTTLSTIASYVDTEINTIIGIINLILEYTDGDGIGGIDFDIANITLTGTNLTSLADSRVLTSGTELTVFTNTFYNDDICYQIEEGGVGAENNINFYLEFDLGVDSNPVRVLTKGRLNEGALPARGDTIRTYGYRWTIMDWVLINPAESDIIGMWNGTDADNELYTSLLVDPDFVNDTGLVRISWANHDPDNVATNSLEDGTTLYLDYVFLEHQSALTITDIYNQVVLAQNDSGVYLDIDSLKVITDYISDNVLAISLGAGTGIYYDTLYVANINDSSAIYNAGVIVSPSGGGVAFASGATDVNGLLVFRLNAGTYDYGLFAQGYSFNSSNQLTIAGNQTDTIYGTPINYATGVPNMTTIKAWMVTPAGDTIDPTYLKYRPVNASDSTFYRRADRLTWGIGVNKIVLSKEWRIAESDTSLFTFDLFPNSSIYVNGVQDTSSIYEFWIYYEDTETQIFIEVPDQTEFNPYSGE